MTTLNKLKRGFQIGIPAIAGLLLLIFVVQNWKTGISLVLLGSVGGPIPLPIALVSAYLLGGGIGALFLFSERFHDYYLLRRARKAFIAESRTSSFDHYLPGESPRSTEFVAQPSGEFNQAQYPDTPYPGSIGGADSGFSHDSDEAYRSDYRSSPEHAAYEIEDDEDWRPPGQWDY